MTGAQRRPNLAQVAGLAGVSRSTVSRALRDDPQIATGTRLRVKAIAEELGYRPDPILADFASANARRRNDRPERTVILAMACRASAELHRSQAFMCGIDRYAREHAYTLQAVLISEVDAPPDDIRGILLLDYGHHEADTRFRSWIGDRRSPVVALSPNDYACPYDSVGSNHVGAMHILLEEIAERGYRRPGLALSDWTDLSGGYAWSAAYYGWLQRHDGPRPPILRSGTDQELFNAWIDAHDIDVVISRKSFRNAVAGAGRPLGYANLGIRSPESETTGLLQNFVAVGEAAMRHLDGAIRSFSSGRPAHPKMVLVSQQWHEGTSLPPLRR